MAINEHAIPWTHSDEADLHDLVLLEPFGDRPLLELDADGVDAVPLVCRGHAFALELRPAKATDNGANWCQNLMPHVKPRLLRQRKFPVDANVRSVFKGDCSWVATTRSKR